MQITWHINNYFLNVSFLTTKWIFVLKKEAQTILGIRFGAFRSSVPHSSVFLLKLRYHSKMTSRKEGQGLFVTKLHDAQGMREGEGVRKSKNLRDVIYTVIGWFDWLTDPRF